MKKCVCILLALLMVCLPMVVWAEDEPDEAVVEAFCEDWIDEDKDEYALSIWYIDGEFDLVAVRPVNELEYFAVEFERCAYDAQRKALLCEGGVLLHEALNEEDWEIILSEPVASGFSAVLTVDENGKLSWTGSGDVMADRVFAIWEYEEEDDGLFVGDWECGDTWIQIILEDGVYTVYAAKDVSDDEMRLWEYTCLLDSTSGTLTGRGLESIKTFVEGEETDVEGETLECTVTFTLDNGELIWNESREDAGQGLRFVRMVDEEDDIED